MRTTAADGARTLGAWAWLAILLIAAVSLWMRTGFPVLAIPDATFDDGLFVYHARTLGAGQWLGDFSNTTLVKGPFYPAFILAAFLAGVPLKIAEHFVYLAACLLVAWAPVRLGRAGRGGAVALFLLLAFNPVAWSADLSRVIREGLYLGLSLGLVGLATAMSFGRRRPLAWRLALGVATGAVGAAYWLTREEGLWLVPSLLAVAGIAWAGSARRSGWRGALSDLAWPWVAALATAALLVAGVATQNRRHYGVFETTEVQTHAFQHAYGAIARITPAQWQRYVVFPTDARQRAYAVSAAAAELAPALDGPNGARWRQIGCESMPGARCDEILSGWFQWALRDAVAAAGHYRSAKEAARYYNELAAQLDDACARGALACGPPRATLSPPFRWGYLSDTAQAAGRVWRQLASMGAGHVAVTPSRGQAWAITEFSDMVGPVRHPSAITMIVEGSIVAAGRPALAVRTDAGDAVASDATLQNDPPDSAGHRTTHFRLSTDCRTCDLLIALPGEAATALPLGGIVAGVRQDGPGFALTPETVLNIDLGKAGDTRRLWQTLIAIPLAQHYAALMGAMLPLGCVGIALAVVLRRDRPACGVTVALVAASALAVATRVLLLAYLDATSIPAASLLYASPATPFLVTFAVGGCRLGVAAVQGRSGSRIDT